MGKWWPIKIVSSSDKDDVMLMTTTGAIVRLSCKSISLISRNTNGVLLVRLVKHSKIAAITSFNKDLLLFKQDEEVEKDSFMLE